MHEIYGIPENESKKMPYVKFFEYIEMASIREGLRNGLEVKSLLSSFEQYKKLKPIHDEILERAKQHAINSR